MNDPLIISQQCTRDSEHRRRTPPTATDITSQPSSSPSRSPPLKCTQTGSGFKSFHLNKSNNSSDEAALDDALHVQKHTSPDEVRLLCMFHVSV